MNPLPWWVAPIERFLTLAKAEQSSGELVVRFELKKGRVVRQVVCPPAEVVGAPHHDSLDGGGTLTVT